ncbi:MAG: (Fe-S)-binding protein [Bacteroidales bacterium]|jgi:L-lactate dehydrogenase complex protein LldE|nr:(Fe-S)-binding protein [Bacteroidales bacterium]
MPAKIFFPFEIDQFYPDTAQNALRILQRLDYSVEYDPEQTDCGKMAFENGNWGISKNIAEKFIKTFADSSPLIIPSISNVNFIKNHYKKLFYNSGLHLAYQKIAHSAIEFCEFIYNHIGARDIGAVLEREAVFHDCFSDKPNSVFLNLLSHVKGLKLLEVEGISTECCGAGFIFGLNNETIASAMAMRLLKIVSKLDIRTIIVGDIECKFHLDNYLKKQKSYISVVHIIDVLASGWQNPVK